jgi:hypothetical protein
MPTILWVGPYRFFFYAGDRNEPPHVHVEWHGRVTKFWLDPVRLSRGAGFRPPELRRIRRIVAGLEADLLRSWNEYFHG